MNAVRAARYPFLRESSALAEENGADVESLVFSGSYSPARERGKERVLDALEHSEVSYRPLMNDYDRLMEIMSYPYARMLVSCVNDRFLTKRYALAESVRMNRLLGSDGKETVASVAKELDVNASADGNGLKMHFGDYLRFSSRIKSPEWKLINTEVKNGYVVLAQEKFGRVLQNALQDRIESELPLGVPEEFVKEMRSDLDHISLVLSETKNRFSPTGGGPVNTEHFPPCMRVILGQTQNGMNLPHSARFALVSFLHALGMDSADILGLFSQSPDFDESKSIYQIKHITGELTGTDGYTPPECSTMKTNGICVNEDNLCKSEKMNHPLTYYRIKSGTGFGQKEK